MCPVNGSAKVWQATGFNTQIAPHKPLLSI